MLQFLTRRLLRAVVALWGIVTIVFIVMRLSGDPVPLMLPPDAPTAEMNRVRAELGLDQPIPIQYLVFIGNVLRGDLGRSIHMRQPAIDIAIERLPATIRAGAGGVPAGDRRGAAGRARSRRRSATRSGTTWRCCSR